MWEIEITEEGTFDVRLEGRAVDYDLPRLQDAEETVRSRGGDEYVFIDEDGFRENRSRGVPYDDGD